VFATGNLIDLLFSKMGRKIWVTDQNYFFLLLIAITAPIATTNNTMVIVIYI